MPALRRCEVWSTYQCASGVRQAVLALQDCSSLSSTERITREDSLSLTIPKASNAAAALALGRVLRLTYDDESFDEWRIHDLVDQSGRDGGRYSVLCRSVVYELRDLALVATTASGLLSTSVTYDGKTAETVVDGVLAYLPGWWARGTITPTTAVSFSTSDATPLRVLRDLITSLDSAGDPAELTVRRNGTTGYYIDIPATIGAGATMADVRTTKNILTSARTRTRETMANRVYPRGSDGSSIEYAYWRVTSIGGSDIEIRQAETGAKALVFDDQLNGLYLENDGGTRTLITASVAGTSTVTVASAAGFAVNEWCRVVVDSGGTGMAKLDYPLASSTKVAIVADGAGGATNIVDNPYMSRWPGSTSAPPIGWQGSGGTYTQNTNLTYIRRGTFSCRFQGTTTAHSFRSDTANVLFGRGTTYSAQIDIYKVTVGVNLTVTLRNQAGTIFDTQTATATGWNSVSFTGINVGSSSTGLYIQVLPATSSAIDCYVDSAQITVGAAQAPWTLGSGPANVFRRALVYLEDNAFEPTSYTLTVADLARWSPEEWPYDAFTLGATLNMTDTELGIATSSRLTEISRDHLNPLGTSLVLERTTRTLTTTLAASA